MPLSASRALFLALILTLALLSLAPHPRIEGYLDRALLPVRVLAELTTPLGWLRARETRAAETELASRKENEYALRQELHEDEQRYALPDRPELLAGRDFVHAEVIERLAGERDALLVRIESGGSSAVEVGMPVVQGNVFVGRVVEVDRPLRGQAKVELVTHKRFRVGAMLVPEVPAGEGPAATPPARLVVGGLSSASIRSSSEIELAVHRPSARELPPGWVRTDESDSPLERFGPEVFGFDLGRLVVVREDPRERLYAVEPYVDYRAGLYQLAIVRPARAGGGSEAVAGDVLFDERWLAVRATHGGDPSPWRESLKLGAGEWSGLFPGAALVHGVRLVGRVRRAGPLLADASLLGDPGFSVPALARIAGVEEPRVLGRIVSLGRVRGSSSAVRFRWDAVVGLDGVAGDGAPMRALLFTGSGEPLVPRGLVLGEAELPLGRGPHTIVLEQKVDARDLRHVWVRLAETRPGETRVSAEGGP